MGRKRQRFFANGGVPITTMLIKIICCKHELRLLSARMKIGTRKLEEKEEREVEGNREQKRD